MLAEIEKRLMLNYIHTFTLEECEDRLMLLRYMLRREDLQGNQDEFSQYILEIEERLDKLKQELANEPDEI